MTTRNTSVPALQSTGLGYEYVRCRTGDDDATVQLSQLVACLDHDPHLVFAGHTYVGRDIDVPWLNIPTNLELRLQWNDQAAAD